MDSISLSTTERQSRIDLAAAFQIAARYDWHEAVANHFSLAISADGGTFLMNPRWRHFSAMRPAELLILDSAAEPPPDVDVTAWVIHGTIHRVLPRARCILHLHPPYATALSCLADPRILPIEQTCARFFDRMAIDTNYGGIADNAAEGERLAEALGGHDVLMMGNHGVLTIGASVAEAFDAMYHVERAARTMVLAYSTGRELNILSDDIAEKTARSWQDGGAFARTHFAELKLWLDRLGSDYAA